MDAYGGQSESPGRLHLHVDFISLSFEVFDAARVHRNDVEASNRHFVHDERLRLIDIKRGDKVRQVPFCKTNNKYVFRYPLNKKTISRYCETLIQAKAIRLKTLGI